MISIVVTPRAEGYTRKELKEEFNKYSTKNADLDEFIAAMIKTDQLVQRGEAYFPTSLSSTDEQIRKPEQREYVTELYGRFEKTKKGNYWRQAVAGKQSDDRPDPTSMRIISYQNKEGKWIPVKGTKEKKILIGADKTPVRARSGERWRASLTADVIRENKIKPGTPIRVNIDRIIPRYFGVLRFWGYNMMLMVSFVSTSSGKNAKARNLELKSANFNVEVTKSIQHELDAAGKKLEEVSESWLKLVNPGYHAFLYDDTKCTISVSGPHTGENFTVLISPPKSMTATITLKDFNRNEDLASGTNTLKRDWIDDANKTVAGFFLDTHLTKNIITPRRKSKKGAKKTKATTASPSDTKQAQMRLNFDNQPFKRKK